jgi:hypothetical protein
MPRLNHQLKVLFLILFFSTLLSGIYTLYIAQNSKVSAAGPTKAVNWNLGKWYVNGTYNYNGMWQDLDLMAAAGIKTVRFAFGSHTQSQCSATGFYTRIANELDTRGLSALASISIPNRLVTTATPAELTSYQNWLSTMVTCYKGRFHNYEVWNEPNFHLFWNINERTTNNAEYAASVGYYISYLKTTYETIKAIDPSATVILGGITQNWIITLTDGRTVGSMSRFMEEFNRQGGYRYIDAWAFHPYADYDPARSYSYKNYTGCGTENIKRIDEFKNYIYSQTIPVEHRNKPLWLTEIGWSSTLDEYPGNTKGSDEAKTRCLIDTWEKFRSEGINTPIVYFDYSSDDLSSLRQEGYSLIKVNKTTNQYVLNSAYTAYKNLWSSGSQVPPTRTPTSTPLQTPIRTNTPVPTLSRTPAATGARIGDVNNDGTVNIIDIGIVIDAYAKPVTSTTRADLNRDGIVNIIDIGIVIDNYGR